MRIRRMLTTLVVVATMLGAGLVRPASAVDNDVIACEGTVTSMTRLTFVDVVGTGTATCVWTIGGGTPGTATLSVSIDVSEPTCMTFGSSMTVVVGQYSYTFAYFGAGDSGSGPAAQTGASRNNVSRLAAGGVLAWVDAQRITAPVCAGQPWIAGADQWPRFAFTGYYPPV